MSDGTKEFLSVDTTLNGLQLTEEESGNDVPYDINASQTR